MPSAGTSLSYLKCKSIHPLNISSITLSYESTRKPVVTGKIILFFSIFGSRFLWHQKISVTTKDTAEFNVKHVKHNVITYHKIDQNGAHKSLHVQVRVAIIVTMVTVQLPIFYLICGNYVVFNEPYIIIYVGLN